MHRLYVLLPLLLLTSCSRHHETSYVYNKGSIFGTFFHITYANPRGEDLHEEILTALEAFDNSLSTYNPNSVISRINQNDPGVEVDSYMEACFTSAREISERTDGAFDITVGALVNAWGFGFKNRETITPELIKTLLESTGYEKVRLVGRKIIKDHPDTHLDVSAIAKGMAVDVVADLLARRGCTDYMVEIGGEIAAHGKNPRNEDWNIGINKPIDDPRVTRQEIQTVIPLRDVGMATSGNYRNFYILDGKKYAHTIDPKSGYPVLHNLLSATVIAPDCMTADAYATAFMVMGKDKAIEIVESNNDLEAFLIFSDEDGASQTWASSGFGGWGRKP